MRQLYIKQKVFSLGEKFTVYDHRERPQYFVEGSFFQIPKSFTIYNQNQVEIAQITKKVFSWLPKFYVDIRHNPQIIIEKELTFFKAKYQISAEDITVEGDWWDMDFSIQRRGQTIARIQKKWFTWGDTYEVEVRDESLEEVIVSLVIAIDCVKNDQSASNSASS
ncbi:LURP-one-related/scramblase family protein [Enterococcus sp. LJL98]